MASPLVEYCEQANPGVLLEIRRVGGTTGNARRVQASFLADLEKKALIWVAQRTPSWINSDHLTALGLLGQLSAGSFYAFSRWNKYYLLAVIVCLALNWLGDSLDGTLARVRHQQRPRYGFYVDHMVDSFGAVAMMIYASRDCDRAAGSVPGLINPVVSGDLYAGGVQAVVLEHWAD